MKRTFSIVFVALIVAAGILGYLYYDNANRDFTPWMSVPEMQAYLKKMETPPAGEPEYWKTHWITAAEGRWHGGTAQYRLRHAATPKDREYVWYWFIDQDQDSFGAKLKEYSANGIALVYNNSYQRPDGTTRYQGVWQKVGK